MIPKTKPEFEISISSDAFEDYRILLFSCFVLFFFLLILVPKSRGPSTVTFYREIV